jgi:hypothetical protein
MSKTGIQKAIELKNMVKLTKELNKAMMKASVMNQTLREK